MIIMYNANVHCTMYIHCKYNRTIQLYFMTFYCILNSEYISDELNDPTGEGEDREEEGVTAVAVLSPGPDLLQVVWLRAVHRHRVLVVANMRSPHCHGAPYKLLYD